jgi:type III pantothenate kinase
MLLAVDVGNTNLTLGVFRGDDLISQWRLETDDGQTVDGWGILFRNLFDLAGLNIAEISGIIVSSVVPNLNSSLEQMAVRYFKTKPLIVNENTETGIVIRADNPSEVGADRIVNSSAAFSKHGGPCIAVDFGTAITFDAISAKGEYLGGVICAGIGIASEALFEKTARLPHIEIRDPGIVIGTNTVACLQSGLYYGTLAMLDGILERMIAELGGKAKVIATGGQAPIVCPASKYVEAIEEHLTLEGLRIIWERNRAASPE